MPKRKETRAEKEKRISDEIDAERESRLQPKIMPLRSGERNQLEEDTERLLAADRRNSSSSDKTDYLSREQLILRQKKEVYNSTGIPDASLISGLYKRAYNPELGNRPRKGGSDD